MPDLRMSNKPISSLISPLDSNATFALLTAAQKRLVLAQATQQVNTYYKKAGIALKGSTVHAAVLRLLSYISKSFTASAAGTVHTYEVDGVPAPFPSTNYFLIVWGFKGGLDVGVTWTKTADGFTAYPAEDGTTVFYIAHPYST